MNLINEGTNGLKIKRPVSEPKESWLLQSPPQITGKNRHYWAQNFNNDHKKITDRHINDSIPLSNERGLKFAFMFAGNIGQNKNDTRTTAEPNSHSIKCLEYRNIYSGDFKKDIINEDPNGAKIPKTPDIVIKAQTVNKSVFNDRIRNHVI